VWCGIAPVQERVAAAQKQFGLPDNVIPLSLIPIGVPDQKAGTVDRYREDRIHRNTWK
jgi:nitroreductase